MKYKLTQSSGFKVQLMYFSVSKDTEVFIAPRLNVLSKHQCVVIAVVAYMFVTPIYIIQLRDTFFLFPGGPQYRRIPLR